MILRSHPRRACGALAWGAVFFAVLLGATEWLLPRTLDDNDVTYTVRRHRLVDRLHAVADRRGNVDPAANDRTADKRAVTLIVMLGSSRTFTGLKGQVLEEELRAAWRRDVCAAGFAMPGGGPVHSLVTLGRLLRDGLSPDLLLVEVLPSHLRAAELAAVFPKGSIHLSGADREWLEQHGLPADGDDEEPAKATGPACWRYRSALLRWLLPKLTVGDVEWAQKLDAWGGRRSVAGTMPSAAERRRGVQQAKSEYLAALQNFRLPGPGVTALRAILAECQQHRIPATLVLLPEAPEFRSWYREGAREEIRELLGHMTQECDSGLVDGWDWYEDEAFRDSHHLLAHGAERFSTRLGREIATTADFSVMSTADRAAGMTQFR